MTLRDFFFSSFENIFLISKFICIIYDDVELQLLPTVFLSPSRKASCMDRAPEAAGCSPARLLIDSLFNRAATVNFDLRC